MPHSLDINTTEIPCILLLILIHYMVIETLLLDLSHDDCKLSKYFLYNTENFFTSNTFKWREILYDYF